MNLTFKDNDGNDCAQLLKLGRYFLYQQRTNSFIHIHSKSEASILLVSSSIVPITIYNKKLLIIHDTP